MKVSNKTMVDLMIKSFTALTITELVKVLEPAKNNADDYTKIIIESVIKYNRASEKQIYVIAKGMVDSDMRFDIVNNKLYRVSDIEKAKEKANPVKKVNTKMSEEQLDALSDLVKTNLEAIRSQNQGTCRLHETMWDDLKAIYPALTALGANYYDCDGVRGFALKIEPAFSYDGEKHAGIAIAPRKHLEKYYKFRIQL